jgi:hypothetical protein
MTPEQVAALVRSIITPHDRLQDGIVLFDTAVSLGTSVAFALHLRKHRLWQQQEDPRYRHTGALHG